MGLIKFLSSFAGIKQDPREVRQLAQGLINSLLMEEWYVYSCDKVQLRGIQVQRAFSPHHDFMIVTDPDKQTQVIINDSDLVQTIKRALETQFDANEARTARALLRALNPPHNTSDEDF